MSGATFGIRTVLPSIWMPNWVRRVLRAVSAVVTAAEADWAWVWACARACVAVSSAAAWRQPHASAAVCAAVAAFCAGVTSASAAAVLAFRVSWAEIEGSERHVIFRLLVRGGNAVEEQGVEGIEGFGDHKLGCSLLLSLPSRARPGRHPPPPGHWWRHCWPWWRAVWASALAVIECRNATRQWCSTSERPARSPRGRPGSARWRSSGPRP